MSPTPLPPHSHDSRDDSRDLPGEADMNMFESNDLQSAEFVQCPKCQKYCLVDYAHCPRCGTSLARRNPNRKPLWYVLTVSVVILMIVFYWVLQDYFPAHTIHQAQIHQTTLSTRP